ncbi:hypothetical protein GCM10020216_003890 [Nonomuraea helvata]
MNGRAALVTAADDSPLRLAISTRETGPCVSTMVNTVAAAGVVVSRGCMRAIVAVINFVKN